MIYIYKKGYPYFKILFLQHFLIKISVRNLNLNLVFSGLLIDFPKWFNTRINFFKTYYTNVWQWIATVGSKYYVYVSHNRRFPCKSTIKVEIVISLLPTSNSVVQWIVNRLRPFLRRKQLYSVLSKIEIECPLLNCIVLVKVRLHTFIVYIARWK